tara:strand:+ start:284 stop:1024 length:741 start_codon:yes stop_codon:yes gene_type:complete
MNFKDIKWDKVFTIKRIIFLLVFFVLVLVSKKINFSALVGADSQFFTIFQFFGPIAGSFLGPVFGITAVFLSQVSDYFIVGKEWSIINIARLLPMLFAVYYFGSKKKILGAVIPIICMLLFVVHPIGQQVWFFSLYWLIPVIGKLLPKKVPGQLFFRSYGATFTAHAVGGALWIYTVPSTPAMWISLIPIVAFERFLFGLGIAGSYVVFNTVLDYVVEKWKVNLPTKVLFLDRRYNLMKWLNLRRS